MKFLKLKPLIGILCITTVSSVAFSDVLISVCEYCHQLPKPNPMCIQGETAPTMVFCGAEIRLRQGGITGCKQFDNVTVYCASGSTITYTEERWYGVGTSCAPHGTNGNHACR